MTDKSRSTLCLKILTVLLTLGLIAAELVSLRHLAMSCSDTLAEFVIAHMMPKSWYFENSMNYALLRGRLGFLFPMVATFRYSVFQTDNIVYLWMLQHVPVYLNVLLLSVILGRRYGTSAGCIFAVTFASFLQITGFHNIMICYPLDFMYGLFLAVWGLLLYKKSLESEKSIVRIISVIVSVICYYESMQVYEAYLLFAPLYGIIAVMHPKDITAGKKFWINIKKSLFDLIPHITVSLFFVLAFLYVKSHPIVTGETTADSLGNFRDFMKTLPLFSGSLFPLSNLLYATVRNHLPEVALRPEMFIKALLSGAGILLSTLLIYREKPGRKLIKPLIVLAVIGGIGALIYPAFHATTEVYQSWAINFRQHGYVPSAVSYFGWIVSVTAVICIILIMISGKGRKIRAIAAVAVTVAYAAGAFLTVMINDTVYDLQTGPTNPRLSYRAQTFYAFCMADGSADLDCDVLWLRSFSGVHGTFVYHKELVNHMQRGSIAYEITSDTNLARDTVRGGGDVAEYINDYDSLTGALVTVTGITDEDLATCEGDILLASIYEGDRLVTYELSDGTVQAVSVHVTPGSFAHITPTGPFAADSVDIQKIV